MNTDGSHLSRVMMAGTSPALLLTLKRIVVSWRGVDSQGHMGKGLGRGFKSQGTRVTGCGDGLPSAYF